jgi:hypothetical protein
MRDSIVMHRRVIATACVVAAALVTAASAFAGATAFAYGRYWSAGGSASSAYSSSWYKASFNKQSSGHDTTITLIDNVSYSWHGTRRDSALVTWTDPWFSSVGKKGYCKAWSSNFYGSCYVYS